jgi:hypothetical protein
MAPKKTPQKVRKLVMTVEPDGFRITTEATDKIIVAGDFQCHYPEIMARMVRLYNKWVEREQERIANAVDTGVA